MNKLREHLLCAMIVAASLPRVAIAQDRTPDPPAPDAAPTDPYLLLQPPRAWQPGEVRWLSRMEPALVEARVRNLPVFVVCGNDASPVMQAMLETVYLKPAFAALNDLAVPVIAMTGLQHANAIVTTGDQTIHMCGYFKVPCEEHDQLIPKIRERYITRQFSIPLHLFLQASGDEFLRLEGEHTEKRLFGELKRLAKNLGPSINWKTYTALINGVQEMRDLLKAHQVRAALEKYQSVARSAPHEDGVNDWLKSELDRLLADGRDRLRIARKLIASNRRAEALAMVSAVAEDYEGYPIATEANALRAELERH